MKFQRYVLLNSVISNVVAFIVVIGMASSGISYIFLHFSEDSFASRRKKIVLWHLAQSFSIKGQTKVYELITDIE